MSTTDIQEIVNVLTRIADLFVQTQQRLHDDMMQAQQRLHDDMMQAQEKMNHDAVRIAEQNLAMQQEWITWNKMRAIQDTEMTQKNVAVQEQWIAWLKTKMLNDQAHSDDVQVPQESSRYSPGEYFSRKYYSTFINDDLPSMEEK